MNELNLIPYAIKTFGELYKKHYETIEYLINSDKFSKGEYFFWYSRAKTLERKARELNETCETEQSKRAYIKAKRLRIELMEKIQNELR